MPSKRWSLRSGRNNQQHADEQLRESFDGDHPKASISSSPTSSYIHLVTLKHSKDRDDVDSLATVSYKGDGSEAGHGGPSVHGGSQRHAVAPLSSHHYDDTKPPLTKTADRPHLSAVRKYGILAICSMSMFIDIWCYSAFFIFTAPISIDLNVVFEQQVWVITSYAVTFSAFLLFWGRVSDLYSAKPVFTFGFITLGVLNLIISFLPDKYSYFVLRALAGIAGACLVPSSFRLIVHTFEPAELPMAFTLYGMSGALSNVTGNIVAGFIMYIPGTGQMAAWRWFFRILAALILPIAFLSLYLIPKDRGDESDVPGSKWRRLDLVGALIILSAIVLLTLGLTLGASYGWKKAGFLVPFLLSVFLFPAFFFWEDSLEESHALVPTKTWKIPNLAVYIALALEVYPWWGVNFLGLVEWFMKVKGEKAIVAAVRILPQGVMAVLSAGALTFIPVLVSRPNWTVFVGLSFGIVGYVLMTRSTTFVGKEYWRFVFPGSMIGSFGSMMAFTCANVFVMTAVPPEASGVAGALLQVALQVGSTVGLSVQAGLLTVNKGGFANPDNLKASFYFQMGWCALWLVGFMALYRKPKKPAQDIEHIHDATATASAHH